MIEKIKSPNMMADTFIIFFDNPLCIKEDIEIIVPPHRQVTNYDKEIYPKLLTDWHEKKSHAERQKIKQQKQKSKISE
ncbi:MAG: hypothetical protein ACTS73_06225 [Arsenophonus sp. NEOnobi-MAG3]